ncbi:hypothetical protein K456DRAFT_1349306 [Colletotrichum gloeosporioides 23]|nr:hypothetical protein K456DRAFT_1349306 [Colletotrichum gloeosporioides 23]
MFLLSLADPPSPPASCTPTPRCSSPPLPRRPWEMTGVSVPHHPLPFVPASSPGPPRLLYPGPHLPRSLTLRVLPKPHQPLWRVSDLAKPNQQPTTPTGGSDHLICLVQEPLPLPYPADTSSPRPPTVRTETPMPGGTRLAAVTIALRPPLASRALCQILRFRTVGKLYWVHLGFEWREENRIGDLALEGTTRGDATADVVWARTGEDARPLPAGTPITRQTSTPSHGFTVCTIVVLATR